MLSGLHGGTRRAIGLANLKGHGLLGGDARQQRPPASETVYFSLYSLTSLSCGYNINDHMKINEDHLYHGAALTQIAEFPTFKAINPFVQKTGTNSRSAFIINNDTGIYIKYATKPSPSFGEYIFTFTQSHLQEISELKEHFKTHVYIVMVCLKAHEICVITADELDNYIAQRRSAKGSIEEQYQLLLTLVANGAFRVYMNHPGKKKKPLAIKKVRRNRFPVVLFESGK